MTAKTSSPRKQLDTPAEAPASAWRTVVLDPREQHERKRQVLLREAARCFNRSGFQATSLAKIADKLGVSKAALYTYVKSKHDLLFHCHSAAMDQAEASLGLARSQGRSGLEQLRLTMQMYAERILSEDGLYMVLLEEGALKPAHAAEIIGRRDAFERQLRAMVERGIADASIAPCNPKLAIFMVLGAINWIAKWFSTQGAWNSRQVAVAVTELLERALAQQPSSELTQNLGGIR